MLIFLTEQDRRLKITAAGVPADRVSVTDTACDELTERVAALREMLARAGLTPFYRFPSGTGGIITTPGGTE